MKIGDEVLFSARREALGFSFSNAPESKNKGFSTIRKNMVKNWSVQNEIATHVEVGTCMENDSFPNLIFVPSTHAARNKRGSTKLHAHLRRRPMNKPAASQTPPPPALGMSPKMIYDAEDLCLSSLGRIALVSITNSWL